MMVTFVSQCEKKAIKRTNRILDAYANRIGDRTWQTVITNEGLDMVKKLLKKTASKNTAVSCHLVKGRSRTELIWVVGSRYKFNDEGLVPVNRTQKEGVEFKESYWSYLAFTKSLVAIAALFHDIGKANCFFQSKLRERKPIADPLRHEWMSCLYLVAFVQLADNKEYDEKVLSDESWLNAFSRHTFNEEKIIERMCLLQEKYGSNKQGKPMHGLPPIAAMIAWLVLSHHRLPMYGGYEKDSDLTLSANICFLEQLEKFNAKWWYETDATSEELAQCFTFKGSRTPFTYPNILKEMSKWGNKMLNFLAPENPRSASIISLVESINAGDEKAQLRSILIYSRLALVLGDHHYSSIEIKKPENIDKETWIYRRTANKDLIANLNNEGKPNQFLDEHLLGVLKKALDVVHSLPGFIQNEDELPFAHDIKILKKRTQISKFKWQDKAQLSVKKWRIENESNIEPTHFPFFVVNMASTGTGKTFANAKIMHALSPDLKSLRFNLALGLRTLTLQTGDEYKDRLGLDDTQLTVKIGSSAVTQLHNLDEQADKTESKLITSGSESVEGFYDGYYTNDFNGLSAKESKLTAIFPEEQRETVVKALFPAVMVSTIDHLMGASETLKGGRFILPSLRLLTSDLVIDEIDDFDPNDLNAISRLVNLAGLFGRKVMISSATIPPDLAKSYFRAYMSGWKHFAMMHKIPQIAGVTWVDEFNTRCETLHINDDSANEQYKTIHNEFVLARIVELAKLPAKRKVKLVDCNDLWESRARFQSQDKLLHATYASKIQKSIVELHKDHHIFLNEKGKKISFGVVRVANISPCIGIFTELLKSEDWPEDTEVRVMPYHSRQVLLMRSEQEKHLAEVLARHKEDEENQRFPFLGNKMINRHVTTSKKKHLIFVLVATPVEEVGRDHDFDWAVVEPSSFRSIIQLAGRVLRHREKDVETPNVHILSHNIKTLKIPINRKAKKEAVYWLPGYENSMTKLHDKSLFNAFNEATKLQIAEKLDSRSRIHYPSLSELDHTQYLIDLEHYVLHHSLKFEVDTMNLGNIACFSELYWWMSAMPMKRVPFRNSTPQVELIYAITKKDELTFCKEESNEIIEYEKSANIMLDHSLDHHPNLWLNHRSYISTLEHIAELIDISPRRASLRFGGISVPQNHIDSVTKLQYSDVYGLKKWQEDEE